MYVCVSSHIHMVHLAHQSLKCWLYLGNKPLTTLLSTEPHLSQLSRYFKSSTRFILFCLSSPFFPHRLHYSNSPWTFSIHLTGQPLTSLLKFLHFFPVSHFTYCSLKGFPPTLNSHSAHLLVWMKIVSDGGVACPPFPPPPHHRTQPPASPLGGQGMFVELLVTYWLDSCCKSLLFNYKE